uniref:Top1 n=1 Tax=Arundo donax TaxID=35708 RepID=A0A0A9DZR8_ARUDO
MPGASFIPGAGRLDKNKHRALPFLAAISVREKGWKLDQTDWAGRPVLLESEFWVNVHCPSKFREK